jgi:hypothetical protein
MIPNSNYLNEEANHTEPSPSVSVPCYNCGYNYGYIHIYGYQLGTNWSKFFVNFHSKTIIGLSKPRLLFPTQFFLVLDVVGFKPLI